MHKASIPLLAAGLWCLAAAAQPAHAESGLVVSHHETLTTYEFGPAATAGQQKPGVTATLSFDALGRRYDLELEPNSRLLSDAARAGLRPGVAVYRGRVAGLDGSWVRIVVADGVPSGVIWDGREMLAIEAPGDSAVRSDAPVIYRLKDTYVVPGTMSCGTGTSGTGSAAYNKLVGELQATITKAAAADLQLDLGIVGDFELFQRFNNSVTQTEEAILARLNTVDGIYSEQLGVQLRVEELQVFATASDPFSDETEAGILLDEVGAYRRNTPAQLAQGLTHLYTGRNLDTTTVGIAYLDALCTGRFGVGLSEDRSGAFTAALIAAHEIGHNFGAHHDGDEEGPCGSTPEDFLMAPSVNNNDTFSQCSIDTIAPKIAAASCITAAPTVDMSIGLDGNRPPALLGTDLSLSFTADNAGTQSATGVAIDVSLPGNVTFRSASTEFGTCTSGAGSVSCTYGTVPGNGERSVTIAATASAVGDGTFTATVSADTDVDPGNDSESVTLTVEPAVDLVVNPVAVARTEVDQAVSVTFDLENRSILGASGVALSVTLGGGIRATGASWTFGACEVSDQQVDCAAADFGAQSAATLDLTLAGISNGQSSYTVSLSSAEADADDSDNSVTATVQVGPVTMPGAGGSPGGGGGGGSAPFLLVLLAGWTTVRLRRGALRRD